jgi:hypothetical protein
MTPQNIEAQTTNIINNNNFHREIRIREILNSEIINNINNVRNIIGINWGNLALNPDVTYIDINTIYRRHTPIRHTILPETPPIPTDIYENNQNTRPCTD